LDSAHGQARCNPATTSAPVSTFDDPLEIAAAYLSYLCRNHPFVDGNKRTALVSCLVFLHAHTLLPDPDLPGRHVDDWKALVIGVASSRPDRTQTPAHPKRLLLQDELK
jgi:death on curing protein